MSSQEPFCPDCRRWLIPTTPWRLVGGHALDLEAVLSPTKGELVSTKHQTGRLPMHPVTRSLVRAIQENVWPGTAATEAFGLKTVAHAEALYAVVLSGKVTTEELDEALGDGPAITRLVSRAAGSSHPPIEYATGWEVAATELKQRKATKKDRRPGYES